MRVEIEVLEGLLIIEGEVEVRLRVVGRVFVLLIIDIGLGGRLVLRVGEDIEEGVLEMIFLIDLLIFVLVGLLVEFVCLVCIGM